MDQYKKPRAAAAWTLLILVATSHAIAQTAQLQPATSMAYDKYAKGVETELTAKAQSSKFLRVHAHPDKLKLVNRGEAVVEPASGEGDVEVAGGVIHDWIGTVLIPGATIDQAMKLVRDYENYKSRYGPDIADSKVLGRSGDALKVYLRLAKKLLFTVVMNSEHDVKFRQIDARRWTSSAVSTKLVEVENPGTPGEKEKPEGTGTGFLWRTNTYFVIAEQDGRVYFEMRSLSLSNPLPPGLGFLQSIVVKLPRQTVIDTLEATRAALKGRR